MKWYALENVKADEDSELAADAVFIAIGYKANIVVLKEKLTQTLGAIS